MGYSTIKKGYLALWVVGILTIPTTLYAAKTISLNDHEKKLVDSGEIIVREVKAHAKNGRTFEAVGLINTPRTDLVKVLTDYEKYPEFMPNITHIKIIEQNGKESVLNYTLTLPMGKVKKYRLRLFVTEPEDKTSLIQWKLKEWPGLKKEETIKDTTGYWCIKEKTKNSSLVLYHVYTDPGPVPFGLGWIVDVLSKNSVPKAFLHTKQRTEKNVHNDDK